MAIILTQTNLLSGETCGADLVVHAPQFRGPVGILLIPPVVIEATLVSDGLTRHKRWQHSLLRIRPHLSHYIIMILFVQVCNLGQSNLVATVLVFIII